MEFTEDPTRERLVHWLHSMVYDPALVTEELIEERWAQATDPATLAARPADVRQRGVRADEGRMARRRRADAVGDAAQGHGPTLLTWGRDDRVSPVDMALLPMRTIPNAELHVFPNCGHWVMIEHKAAWRAPCSRSCPALTAGTACE